MQWFIQGAQTVKWLNICLFIFKERMLYFPTGFVFRAGGKPVHYERRSTREILSPWSWRYFSWAFFAVFLSCRKSVKEKIGRRKKSNSKPYDFYFYSLNKESGGRCTVGQRYLYIWYKSSKPDLVIFNAGVTLLTLAAPDAYQLKWKVGTWTWCVDHTDGFMPEINLAQ